MAREEKLLSRKEVEGLIADGHLIVIYENKVLKVESWLPLHPGGAKVMEHMVGRDATDEINCYHSEEARAQARRYQIGKIEGAWKNFVPPIQGGKFRPFDEAVIVSDSSSASSDDECADTKLKNVNIKTSQKSCRNVPADNIVVSPVAHDLPQSQELMAEYEKNLLEADLAKYPSLDYDTQLSITKKYRQLEAKLQREGYFRCTYWGYGREFSRISLLGSLAYFFLKNQYYYVSAFFLGLFWHQLVFIAHDAAHHAITHSYFWDNIFAVLVADWFGGLSIGWWKRNHNVHHFVTNDPVHDPDIQHLPFFAVSTKLFGSVFSTYYERTLHYDAFAKALIKIQNYMYYPLLCLGRFNLYRLSFEYLLLRQGPRKGKAVWISYFEIAGLIFFWYWFGYRLVYVLLPNGRIRFAYVMISHIVTMPVHVQITLSHFAMSTVDLGQSESFAQKMLRTTMDVDCPSWLDFIHGGLQFQAVHHLFPRMPRHNFRAAQAPVIEFCKDVGIEYCIYGFYDGNKEVISRLADIAKQAVIMAECSNHMAQEARLGKF
ncbi:fatty acid desaturase-domain-containing protein [Lipomyces japonicus]|uniref:fatty acid desaturase-domain-containing protein n=1 Tax=Lipomyces japonicus TaxID=56871 RepID=UPI0034CE888B